MSEREFMTDGRQQAFPFTLRDAVAIGFRHRRVMGLCFSGILLGVILSIVFLPSKYQAETQFLVERQRVDPMVTPEQNAPVMLRDTVAEEELNSEVELIHSVDVLRAVVLGCGLDKKKSLLSWLNFWRGDEERIARSIRKLGVDVHAEPIKKTNIIDVTYASEDPKLAAQVLKVLEKVYLDKHRAVHRPTGQFQFFEQETDQYKKSLTAAEERLKTFSTELGGVAPEMMRDLTLQKLNEFNSTLATTRSQIAETEKRIQSLQSQAGSTPSRLTTQLRKLDDAQVLQQLKATLMTLELKRTELLTKYQPSYPLVQEVDKQIADTRAALAKEEDRPLHEETTDQNPTYEWINGELAKAKTDLSGLQAREAAGQAIVNLYGSKARVLDAKGIMQQDLLRTRKANEDNYLLYLKKQEEARIADALDQTHILNVAVAQEAVVPTLPSRSPWILGLLGCLMAAVTSVGMVITVDYMDQSFRTPTDVLAELNIPVLAAVPHQNGHKNGNGNGNDNSNRKGTEIAHIGRNDTEGHTPAQAISQGNE